MSRFSTAERLISTRQSLMSASLTRDTSASPSLIATVSQEQKACYLALSAAARRTGSLQTAFNAVIAVRQLPSAVFSSQDVQDELTQVLWDQAEHSLAIRTAEEMTGRLDRKKKEDGAKLAVMLGRIVSTAALLLGRADVARRTGRPTPSFDLRPRYWRSSRMRRCSLRPTKSRQPSVLG